MSDLRVDTQACGCVRRGCGVGLDAPSFHVGYKLVWDLSQNVLGQPGHAQHVVACAVNVISERHELKGENT